jgi:hypothetical protein
MDEDAPANAVGGGHIAGVGIGSKGEPGRSPMAMLRRKKIRFKEFIKDNKTVYYKALGRRVPVGKSSSSRGGNGDGE